jgi:hypothetical protein
LYEVGVFPSMTKGEIVGHIVIDVLSLMSTFEDHCDVMMSFYDELSLMTNKVQKNVIKSSEEIAMNRSEGRTLIEAQKR